MSNDLERKSEELEQTLSKQLEILKKDSEDWLKVGAAVAAGALLTYGIVKLTKSKNKKETQKAIEVLEKEGLLNSDIKKRLTETKRSSIWPSLGQRLLILGLAVAKEKLFREIFASQDKVGEVEEDR
ncbi:MAG: hypothetical protein B7Z16_01470 [Algoriphagus sp. 32-45-6]|jgi:hypothetical protein|nr:MAG: hypothetical protein B7Z16_01470 [Algoriphagus sp. 32-45-6]